MPIDPWLAGRFELIRDIPSFDAALADPELGAQFVRYLEDPAPWAPPAGVSAEDARADAVPLKIFRPATPRGSALLWFHGGGFVRGSVDDTESTIPGFELAQRSGAIVVSVGYRLAIDGVHYPAPVEDAMTAWGWLVAHAADLGVDRLFVGGASVGASLATAVAVRLRDRAQAGPRGMLLAYPLEHFPIPPLSASDAAVAQLPAMLRFPEPYQVGIVQNYVGRLTDLPDDVAPGNFPVDGLPEAWIAPAEYDDLRPSGEEFARQLTAAGIPVHLELAAGMVHGFLGRGPSLLPVDRALDFFASALR